MLFLSLLYFLTPSASSFLLTVVSKTDLPTKETALPGQDEVVKITNKHAVNGNPLKPPFPENMEMISFGLGCFWGAERLYWKQKGVYSTHVGYSGGFTKNPTYKQLCSGDTGHTEVVRVVYDPKIISLSYLLQLFWENHNPTEGMKQGVDIGTQYRSAIYTYTSQQYELASRSRDIYQEELTKNNLSKITTEINRATEFYYAEDYHQQYLHKNPDGFCGLGGTGVPMCQRGLEIPFLKQKPKDEF